MSRRRKCEPKVEGACCTVPQLPQKSCSASVGALQREQAPSGGCVEVLTPAVAPRAGSWSAAASFGSAKRLSLSARAAMAAAPPKTIKRIQSALHFKLAQQRLAHNSPAVALTPAHARSERRRSLLERSAGLSPHHLPAPRPQRPCRTCIYSSSPMPAGLAMRGCPSKRSGLL